MSSPKTIGIEVESVINTKDGISTLIPFPAGDRSPIKSIVRDASVESPSALLTDRTSLYLGRTSVRNAIMGKRPTSTTGFEIVTKPLEMSEMREVIRTILNSMIKQGEIYSPRSSIHVHVGYPSGFIFYKTAMA